MPGNKSTSFILQGSKLFDASCRVVSTDFLVLAVLCSNSSEKIFMRHMRNDHDVVPVPTTGSISYSSSRGGVSIIVEKGPTTISYLLITSAMDMDAGVYTCAPSNYNATSVNLHICKEKNYRLFGRKTLIPSKEKAASQVPCPTTILLSVLLIFFAFVCMFLLLLVSL
ncbi:uncharacterized protein [Macrobrachium rosenbergii]|uniref:uncharacterized protein n=1 Tax=Macrobrachium rosenbergii TaxID=79674 RepID=UPI0034D777F3